MAAAMNGDVDLIQKLLPLATNPAATDRNGRTALDYAIAAGKAEAVEVLLPTVPDLAKPAKDGRNAFVLAVDAADPAVTGLVFQYLPAEEQWSDVAIRALEQSLAAGNKAAVKLLISKHALPPMRPGKSVPLFACAIALNDQGSVRLLLECGADPDTDVAEQMRSRFSCPASGRASQFNRRG